MTLINYGILSINGPFDIAMLAVGIPAVPLSWRCLWGNGWWGRFFRQKKLQNTGKSVENHWKISRFTDFLLGRRQISGNRRFFNRNDWFQDLATSLAVILFKTKLKKIATFVPLKSDKTILCGKFDMKTQQIRFAHHPIPGIATGQLRKWVTKSRFSSWLEDGFVSGKKDHQPETQTV